MFRFLASLFAADATSTPASANRFRPQLTGMEDRDAPASLAAVAFDPQPEPPSSSYAVVSKGTTGVPGPGFVPGITKAIVIGGG
jgi:hypothetical protein